MQPGLPSPEDARLPAQVLQVRAVAHVAGEASLQFWLRFTGVVSKGVGRKMDAVGSATPDGTGRSGSGRVAALSRDAAFMGAGWRNRLGG